MMDFKDLIALCKKHFPRGHRWCMRIQMPRTVMSLKAEECSKCVHLLMNGGICDPL